MSALPEGAQEVAQSYIDTASLALVPGIERRSLSRHYCPACGPKIAKALKLPRWETAADRVKRARKAS